MRPNGRVLLLGVIAMACSACVPTPGPGAYQPSSAGVGPRLSPTTSCSSAQFLEAKVRYLRTGGFDFNHNGFVGPGKTYAPPDPRYFAPLDPNNPQQRQYAIDLTSAFNYAPPWFQQVLCNDTAYVFVDQANQAEPVAWGFWENGEDQYPPGKNSSNYALQNYIGISELMWAGNPQRGIPASPTLHQYETLRLRALLTNVPLSTPIPSYGPANIGADIFGMTLLAILAHETGHVIEHTSQTRIRNCVSGSWSDWPYLVRGPKRIHQFRDEFGTFTDSNVARPSSINALYPGNQATFRKDLGHIFGVDSGTPGGRVGQVLLRWFRPARTRSILTPCLL